MRYFVVLAVCVSSLALAGDAYPWPDGTVTMKTAKGQTLTWVIKREGGEVLLAGSHPLWQVEHRAKSDGTPVSTTRKAKGNVVKVTYSPDGAALEKTNAKGERKTATVKAKGLWDSDTCDLRLAGVPWSKGKKVRFRIADVDDDVGETYPMVAEYVREEKLKTSGSNEVNTHRVHLALDDWRRPFAPSFDFFYAVDDLRYVRLIGDGMTFTR